MSPYQWLATLRRRWYVLALSAFLTIVGVLAVHERAIPYSSCNTLVLSGPYLPWIPNASLNQNPSLAVTTGIVTATVNSQLVKQELRAAGVTAYYTVNQENTGSPETPAYTAPLLQVCASAAEPWIVVDTINVVTSKYRAILHQVQADAQVQPQSMITATTLVPAIAGAGTGRPSQAYLGVLLIGIISGLALTVWSDPWIDAWQRRRRAAALTSAQLPVPATRSSR